jgi:hypothetical protein
MIKANSGLFFKALTMGLLLTSGSMGTDGKDKRDPDASKTPYKSISNCRCEDCAVLANGPVIEVSTAINGSDKTGIDIIDASFKSHSSDAGEVDIIRLIEEREQAERAILRQPRVLDLSEKSVVAVLNLMKNARLLSAGQTNPVRVNLTLNNITPLQLENIMFDENREYIEEINWTLVGKPQMLTDDGELIDEDEDDLKKTKDDDDLKKDKDEDEDDLKKIKDEDEDDLNNNIFRNLRPHVDPRGIDNVPRLRRAAARGRNAPHLNELVKDPAQELMLLPPIRLNGNGAGVGSDYLIDPTLVSWGSTSKNGIDTAGSENLGNPSLSSRAQQKGLVHIFCKQDSAVAARAQVAG